MTIQEWPTTTVLATIFAKEIAEAGGMVTDQFEDGARLLARSILPGLLHEVSLDDRVQGGVAIRATDREIQVHPYVFRQVCQNGAIRAQAIQTLRVVREEAPELVDEAPLDKVRDAIRVCCSVEAFSASVEEMRSAREVEADAELMMLPMLVRLPRKLAIELFAAIVRRFTSEGDYSWFGLMNAMTSVARDTSDPDLRWRLEELGGGVPLAFVNPPPTLEPARTDMVIA